MSWGRLFSSPYARSHRPGRRTRARRRSYPRVAALRSSPHRAVRVHDAANDDRLDVGLTATRRVGRDNARGKRFREGFERRFLARTDLLLALEAVSPEFASCRVGGDIVPVDGPNLPRAGIAEPHLV